jgi:hypothetical protein
MTAENETIITKAIKEAIPDLVTIAVDIVNDIRESGWRRDEIEQDLDQVIKSEYRDNRHRHTDSLYRQTCWRIQGKRFLSALHDDAMMSELFTEFSRY